MSILETFGLLYALGFFFAAGRVFTVLMLVEDNDDTVIVSKALFWISMLVELFFWFITVPLSMSKDFRRWNQRNVDALMHPKARPVEFIEPMPDDIGVPLKLPAKCDECGETTRELCWQYACGHTLTLHEETERAISRLYQEAPHV